MTHAPQTKPLALIVDDAATVRMYHRSLVEAEGWEAIEAENGVEALEKVAGRKIDLMMVDVNMPVMDGYRFVEAARASSALSDTPALMISTEAQLIDSDKAFASGANHYIVKPARPEHLAPVLALLRPEVMA